MSGPDWGLGRYELTAAQLLPAAEEVVQLAGPRPGERVLDLGCGTGNAALLAARRGAAVTGVDPAQRLLDVAAARAREQGLEATFVCGDGASLPLADRSVDLAMSVFGVIFAPDAEAAIAELARVTAAGGRIVLSAWLPEGPISEATRASRQAISAIVGGDAGGPPFAWHDRDALTAAFAPHGFEVSAQQRSIAFAADSPATYLQEQFQSHPLWVAGRAVLEPAGKGEEVRKRVLQILEAGNEQPGAFRVTSRYVIATASRA